LKIDKENLIKLLVKYLPNISKHIEADKRAELLPIVLLLAVFEQEEMVGESNNTNSDKECTILRLLFDLIERPNTEQR
jgi:hypothetical protein